MTEIEKLKKRTSEECQCAVCWGLLCEPVTWPGCGHCYCLVCALKTRQRPKPTCPLCRQAAPRVRRTAELSVDPFITAQVRKTIGFSRYEVQRREVLSEAATLDAFGEFGRVPLCSMGPWRLVAGSRHQMRLTEPRYKEMARRALASGGSRRLALVLQPAEFEVGARGRVCEIVEGLQEPNNGAWRIVVDCGAPCVVTELLCEDIEPGDEPLFHATLEELEEEELEAGPTEAVSPLGAATEMVEVLSTLGRHLREMRRRRMLAAVAQGGPIPPGLEEEEEEDGEMPAGVPPLPFSGEGDGALRLASPRVAGVETPVEAPPGAQQQQSMGAMLNLLDAYQQIISQMDRLVLEAAQGGSTNAGASAASAGANADADASVGGGGVSEATPRFPSARGTPRRRSGPAGGLGEVDSAGAGARTHGDGFGTAFPSPLRTFDRVRDNLQFRTTFSGERSQGASWSPRVSVSSDASGASATRASTAMPAVRQRASGTGGRAATARLSTASGRVGGAVPQQGYNRQGSGSGAVGRRPSTTAAVPVASSAALAGSGTGGGGVVQQAAAAAPAAPRRISTAGGRARHGAVFAQAARSTFPHGFSRGAARGA